MISNPYRVCIIAPPGYIHSSCFLEVAALMKASLLSLGADCDITFNDLADNRTNIILGAHLMKHGDYLRAYRYVPYQLEQLSEREGAFSENLAAVLRGAVDVWDYSRENIAFLAQRGITARYLPVGYHEVLEQIRPAATKDMDVLFYGSSGPRRQPVLDSFKAKSGVAFQHLFGVYGRDRDAAIAHARIVLNLHHYSTRIFEAVRVSYLLNNRCCVVSEESTVYPYEGVDLTLVAYEEIMRTCLDLLKDPVEIDRRANRAYEQFRSKYRMTELLGPVLDQ